MLVALATFYVFLRFYAIRKVKQPIKEVKQL
jgi:hypothetical protein